jgi:hypothetical protein
MQVVLRHVSFIKKKLPYEIPPPTPPPPQKKKKKTLPPQEQEVATRGWLRKPASQLREPCERHPLFWVGAWIIYDLYVSGS